MENATTSFPEKRSWLSFVRLSVWYLRKIINYGMMAVTFKFTLQRQRGEKTPIFLSRRLTRTIRTYSHSDIRWSASDDRKIWWEEMESYQWATISQSNNQKQHSHPYLEHEQWTLNMYSLFSLSFKSSNQSSPCIIYNTRVSPDLDLTRKNKWKSVSATDSLLIRKKNCIASRQSPLKSHSSTRILTQMSGDLIMNGKNLRE